MPEPKVPVSARAKALRRAASRFPATFGERLQRLRAAAGLSQPECARLCGVSERSLSRWENNTTMPNPAVLLLLAAGLDVDPAELLGVASIG
jgi:transcriptional regulator with XRE-family HTH domain